MVNVWIGLSSVRREGRVSRPRLVASSARGVERAKDLVETAKGDVFEDDLVGQRRGLALGADGLVVGSGVSFVPSLRVVRRLA